MPPDDTDRLDLPTGAHMDHSTSTPRSSPPFPRRLRPAHPRAIAP